VIDRHAGSPKHPAAVCPGQKSPVGFDLVAGPVVTGLRF
jgi:hypothetical protein